MNASARNFAGELETLVKCRLAGRIQGFQLTVENEEFVLRGRCLTYHAKQLAQHLVMQSCKVRILANQIEVATGNEA